jgi:hypothetical protein
MTDIWNMPHITVEYMDGAEFGEPDILGWTWCEFGYGGYVGSMSWVFEDFEECIEDLMGWQVNVGRFDLPVVVIPHE